MLWSQVQPAVAAQTHPASAAAAARAAAEKAGSQQQHVKTTAPLGVSFSCIFYKPTKTPIETPKMD